MQRPVGVIGNGAMGLGVVESLVRAGIRTHGRDILPGAQQRARDAGAVVHTSAGALAATGATVIILVVDADQVDAVLFGADGAVAAMSPGGIVILSSTVAPDYVAALAPRLAQRNIALVDAPVSGGPARASAGTMTAMVAGNDAAVTQCAPIFAAIANKIFRVGVRPGDAAKFKIVNNLLAAVNLAAGAQAIALAVKAGLDAQQVFDVINASSGGSWIVADRMPRALAGDYAPRAAAKILTKDVGLAVDFARQLGVETTFGEAALAAFRAAVDAGLGDEDDAALYKYFCAQGRPAA